MKGNITRPTKLYQKARIFEIKQLICKTIEMEIVKKSVEAIQKVKPAFPVSE